MPVLIPHTLDQAVEMASTHPDAHILAGGTDLMVEVNFDHRKPETVLALRHVDELRTWSIDETTRRVHIGSAVPYAEMETGRLAAALPALAEAARTVGSPQIRAAGTIGGNLGTCSPAGDSLPVLAAMEALVHLRSTAGDRSMPFAEFMTGPKRNARRGDEIITGVTMPLADGWQGYAKVGVRNAMVISVASACLALQADGPRLALGSVGPVIIRCRDAEAHAAAHLPAIDDETAAEFGRLAAEAASPIDDHRSTAAYRRHAVSVLAARLLQRGTPR